MLEVLYEDNHLVVINKKTSDIVQGDKTGDTPLSDKVGTYLKEKYNKPGNVFVGVTHRLDRPTSGVLIFARTSKSLARMNEMFKSKANLKKVYWAIIQKSPEKDKARLINYLRKDAKKNKSFVCDKNANGAKEAILDYKTIAKSDKYYLLEINLITGRHHQIRAQLSHIGCPIKGDLKYGFSRSNPDAGISLHARQIEFIHPVKKEPIRIEAPVPKDSLWNYFAKNV